jgi:urea transport system permease protein
LFIAVVLFFPNGLSGIWRDHVARHIDRLIAMRSSKSKKAWAIKSAADGAPAE